MTLLKVFITGGIICAIAEILMIVFHIPPAKILVGYVIAGTFLSAIGLYQHIVDFGGCGATIPLTGFGHTLANGVMDEVDEKGLIGAFIGGMKSVAGGLGVVTTFALLYSLIFSSKSKT